MWDRIAFIALYVLLVGIAVFLITAVVKPFLPPPDEDEARRRAREKADRGRKG